MNAKDIPPPGLSPAELIMWVNRQNGQPVGPRPGSYVDEQGRQIQPEWTEEGFYVGGQEQELEPEPETTFIPTMETIEQETVLQESLHPQTIISPFKDWVNLAEGQGNWQGYSFTLDPDSLSAARMLAANAIAKFLRAEIERLNEAGKQQ